ncbi:MAG: DUF6922 domain-containing protein [Acidimicrobiales bacterium]
MSAAEFKASVADLFANYDIDRVDVDRDAVLVVLSVLRLGSWDQTRALFGFYGRDRVRSVFSDDFFGPRSLPVSVRAFWSNLFFGDVTLPETLDPMERWRPTRVVPGAASEVSAHQDGGTA